MELTYDTVGETASQGRARQPTRSILSGKTILPGDPIVTVHLGDGENAKRYLIGFKAGEYGTLSPNEKTALMGLINAQLKGYTPKQKTTFGQISDEQIYIGMKADQLRALIEERGIEGAGRTAESMRAALMADDVVRRFSSGDVSENATVGAEPVPGGNAGTTALPSSAMGESVSGSSPASSSTPSGSSRAGSKP